MLARIRPAWGLVWARSGRGGLIRTPDADLVEMAQEIAGVGVDPVGTGAAQLVVAIAAGEQSDSEGTGALRGKQVPDRIADHHAVGDVDAELVSGGDEEVGVRFGMPDQIAGDDRIRSIEHAEHLQGWAGAAHVTARRDRPGHIEAGQLSEQLDRAGQRADLAGEGHEVVAVEPGDLPGLFNSKIVLDLAEQGADEEPAAHPDPAMDAPDIERDTGCFQRLPPGEDVLVDTVDQGAVEIEDERGTLQGIGHVLGAFIVEGC